MTTPILPGTVATMPDFGFTIDDNSVDSEYLNSLIYGASGVGKTELMGQLVGIRALGDVLFIDIEGGRMTIRRHADLSVIKVRKFATMARSYEWLRAHCRYRDTNNTERLTALAEAVQLAHPERRYYSVVIDSLSELQKLYMYSLLGIELGKMPLDSMMASPEWSHWNRNDAAIRLLVRQFRDLPINVFFTAGEQVETITGGDADISYRLPDLPGKLARGMPHFLDLVAWYANDERKDEDGKTLTLRRLYVQPGRTYQAKNRFGRSDTRYLDQPTMHDVIELMRTD